MKNFEFRLLAITVAALAVAGCETYPEHPVTQSQVPFDELVETSPGVAPDVASAVTAERLVAARSEPHNWLTYYGAYDGQRHSALDQINTGNVAGLTPAWVFQAGVIGLQAAPATYAFEAAPIVVDGVMFVSGWDGNVWALDARDGTMLWRYRHAIPLDTPLCCGNVNRGVAVAKGKVYYSSANGHLVALDARTGEPVWNRAWLDPRAGESSTMAPLVVKDMVIVGSSGAEYGVRGHIDAFDLDTGERVWRRYPVPKPGEPGSETWGDDDAWERGGGSAWITGTYDPQLDLLYWGTSNPSPDFDGSVRPGDNLYTDSVLALDPDDGTIRWHYQWTPHDVWDYSGVNENILFDHDGEKLLAHFDRNGHLFILDRTNGALKRVTRFGGKVTWGEIAADGTVTPRLIPTDAGVEICPGPAGAKEWVHAAYNPQTGLLYAPINHTCADYRRLPQEFKEGMAYWGGEASVMGKPQSGAVAAFDPATGREVWSWASPQPMVASILSTAGGLVWTGEPSGKFNAWDARTGELLWQFQTGSGIHSSPISYSIDGKQYIAVPSGWGGWLEGFAPEMYGASRGSALFVFALPD